MKGFLLLSGMVIAVGAVFSRSAPAGIERTVEKPPAEVYAAFEQFADRVSVGKIPNICVDRMCDRTVIGSFRVTKTPNERLSLGFFKGEHEVATVSTVFEEGSAPSHTRLLIDVTGDGANGPDVDEKIGPLIDKMIEYVERGERIPTASTTSLGSLR